MLDIIYLPAEEASGQALEFVDRIGHVEAEGTMGGWRSCGYRGPSARFARSG